MRFLVFDFPRGFLASFASFLLPSGCLARNANKKQMDDSRSRYIQYYLISVFLFLGLLLGIFINGLALWGVAPPFDHYASNWVYLPAPPTPYYELNATDTTVTIAWEKDAFHGKAPGHMLYMNDIPVCVYCMPYMFLMSTGNARCEHLWI